MISKATQKNWERLGHTNSLTSRANKLNSTKIFIPTEKIKDISQTKEYLDILNNFNYSISQKLFLTAIVLIKTSSIKDGFELLTQNKQLYKEILNLEKIEYHPNLEIFSKFDFSNEIDFLGSVYQSLLHEGEKSKKGSYFTPEFLIDTKLNKDDLVCDVCCGSGQFLLYFLKFVEPENIYGFDIDEIAVIIARINLLLTSKKEFIPNIYHLDFLTSNINYKFDVIATNPPWGAYFDEKYKKLLKKQYPKLKSYESFSYFIAKSLELLKDNGKLELILPFSIINVKTHQDIRDIISQYNITSLVNHGKVFKNVFSDVITLKIEKSTPKFNFNYYLLSNIEKDILSKIEQNNNYLEAEFGLGIVTGNNKKLITKNPPSLFYEKIYRGKNIDKFFIKDSDEYILFDKSKFQQSLEYEKYKREKILYKFISKKLVLAYDKEGILPLNSLNFFIPQNFDLFFILGIFNSTLYNFYFQKKFNSIKVLKSHLMNLALPKEDKNIIDITKNILNNKSSLNELDEYIFNLFNLNTKEREYLSSFK